MNTKLTCKVVQPGEATTSKQGLGNFEGISAETIGSTGICMHIVTIPPGGRAKAHLHENHESTIYVVNGTAGMWYGENLSEYLEVKKGEFLYIPANMPHLPFNLSETEPCVAVVARTDPSEQESVVMLPELDHVVSK